jgi:hypothetical protein
MVFVYVCECYGCLSVPFAGIDRIIYVCSFLSVSGLSRLCKECTLELLENSKRPAQGVRKNSFRSSVRSVLGGHTKIVLKLRRNSARSAQVQMEKIV